MGLNEKLFVKAVIDLSLPDEVNMNSRYFYTHDHTVQSLFEEFIAPIDIHVPLYHTIPPPPPPTSPPPQPTPLRCSTKA